MTSDANIRDHISALIANEHDLRTRLADHAIDRSDEQSRLQAIERELDQCWDLLRQREAARDSGADLSAVHVRDAATVEGYLS